MEEGDAFLKEVRNFILFDNGYFPREKWMKIYDECFKYCSDGHEQILYETIVESFIELRDQKQAKISSAKEGHEYCLTNPIYPDEKNINRKIVNLATNQIIQEELEQYLKIAKNTQLLCGYLWRMWVPMRILDDPKYITTTNNGTIVLIKMDFKEQVLDLWNKTFTK